MIFFWPIRVKVKASQAIEHRAIEHQAIEHYNTTTPTMHIYIKHCYYKTYAVHYSTTHCYCLEHFVHRTSIQNRTSRLRRIGQTWQIMDYHLITKKIVRASLKLALLHYWFVVHVSVNNNSAISLKKSQLYFLVSTVIAIMRNSTYKCWSLNKYIIQSYGVM